jgi:TonB family protein
MSANILVIEYEPRYVEHVSTALADSSHRLETVANLDGAVDVCAHFEPDLVVITSVLPNLKIEDAITQLRARAGLRVTPFLILMSGYRGEDSQADATGYGAQDILERPFAAETLVERIEKLLSAAPTAAATQAIPQDMLEALRRSAGLTEGESSVTSDELFGDILSEVEGGEQQPVTPPEGGDVSSEETPADPLEVAAEEPVEEEAPTPIVEAPEELPEEPPQARLEEPVETPQDETDTGESLVDRELAGILDGSKPSKPVRKPSSVESDVDAMLTETLAGLDIRPSRAKAPPPLSEAVPEDPTAPELPSEETATPEASIEEPATPEVSIEEPVADDAQEPTGSEFGQYVLEDHIATGGMAEVYKARMMGMEGFQKTVAIKRILSNLTDNDEFVRMFIDEAKLAAQLNHNNIIHIYDLGKIDRSHYIAMEFISGRDLRSVLQECRERGLHVPVALVLYISTLLASALDYAHKKRDFENRDLGLVHRDVSPQNVLISLEGDVKLCDFGIAKAASKASHTRAGALKGKLQYMSPEQAWGKDIDHRSDIFSLGLVLYEMLTLEKVFAGDSELSVLEQVRNPRISAPSSVNQDVEPEMDRIILKALQSETSERYQSARELQRDVEAVMREHGWAPDHTTIARFLRELAEGGEITTTASVSDTAVPPPPPPSEPPPIDGDQPEAPQPEEEPAAEVSDESDLVPEVVEFVAEDGEDDAIGAGEGRGTGRLWMLIAALVVIAAAVGWWFISGSKTFDSSSSESVPPIVTTPTETPMPEPTDTATPSPSATAVPPTATASPTETETEVPPTATAVPPTMTPTPSVREGDIVVLGPGVTQPVAIQKEEPRYPPLAKQMRVEGSVEAQALVGIDGSVEQVRIIGVSRKGMGFEKITEETIMKWRYKPATKNGIKVRMWVQIRVPFKAQ